MKASEQKKSESKFPTPQIQTMYPSFPSFPSLLSSSCSWIDFYSLPSCILSVSVSSLPVRDQLTSGPPLVPCSSLTGCVILTAFPCPDHGVCSEHTSAVLPLLLLCHDPWGAVKGKGRVQCMAAPSAPTTQPLSLPRLLPASGIALMLPDPCEVPGKACGRRAPT